MNAKNIILAILMVLSFAACSSEIEGIDDTMPNTSANNANGTTSISVRMTTEEISTKAGNETLEIVPTTEEAAIKNYMIAVFEKESGERVGYLKGINDTDKNLTKSGDIALTVGGIDCKTGIVNVIVIANLNQEDEARFDAIYKYEEFKTQTIHSNLNNFVKVGEENNKEIYSNRENTITVNLSQLTARVKVRFGNITVNGDNTGVTASFSPVSYQAKQEMSSKIFSPVAGAGNLTESVNLNGVQEFSFYTYKLENPEMSVSTDIVVSKTVSKAETKQITIHKNDYPISFTQGGVTQSVLENGKAYSIEINAIVTVSVQENVPCEVTFSYMVHEIENIDQEIEFN